MVATAADRGLAFQAFLDSRKINVRDFHELSGISYSYLNAHKKGERDIAEMSRDLAERFITAHDISDQEAWEYYGIPEERRAIFRTFRPPPLGHGEPPKSWQAMRLTRPLLGETFVAEGSYITYDPQKRLSGLVVAEVEDGSLYALPAEMAQGRGRVLGQLIAAYFKQD